MINYKTFPNIGYLEVELTEEELLPIKNEIAQIQNDFTKGISHNPNLAGNLEQEYLLTESLIHINRLVFNYLREYDKITEFTQRLVMLTSDCPMIIDRPWVNFQKKHEFNPPHHHSGIASFVIWIKVPYDIKDEINTAHCKNSQNPAAGHFSFHYTNVLGEINNYQIPADRSMENKMLIFPAGLTHSVYPFYTSDEYRISVSGNIKYLIE
jgi:hypothetical protein